jgi:hypothetical protein
MKRTITLLTAVVTAVSLGGCSTASSQGTTEGEPDVGASIAAVEPANPVLILKKIPNCILDAGTSVGMHDIDGNRYVSCSFLDNSGTPGTAITARTYPGDPKQLDPKNLISDDSHKQIVGSDFIVSITGDWSSYSSGVDPKNIATVVGGEFTAPQ